MKKFFLNFLIYFCIYMFVAVMVATPTSNAQTMTYNDFVVRLENDEFSAIQIDPNKNSAYVYLKDSNDCYVITMISFDKMEEAIFSKMDDNSTLKYEITEIKEISYFQKICLSTVLFILFKALSKLIKYTNSRGSNGNEQEKAEKARKPFIAIRDEFSFIPKVVTNISTRFKDVIGLENQIDELNDIVMFLKQPEKYKAARAQIPKGVLLYGPSGTGKTLIARAIAGEAGVPFFYASAAQLQSAYLGGSEKNIRELFEIAKEHAPSIIFLDEIDAIGVQRYSDNSNKYGASMLNQLLTCMDGFEESSGVIVIAATNCKEVLDNAILRRGRFDRHIYIPLPDKSARKKIAQYYLKDKVGIKFHFDSHTYKPLHEELSNEIASITTGFSGADIKTLINEATILAVREDRIQPVIEDIREAFRKITIGVENGRNEISSREKELTAVHEAGHAIVARLLGKTPFEISIISRDSAGGYNLFASKDKTYYSVEDIYKEVSIALGGRAAEKIMLGEVSSGASSDLKHASELLRQMYLNFGMGADREVSLVLIDSDKMNSVIIGDSIKKMEEDINNKYKEVLKMLDDHKPVLEALSRHLYEEETMSGEEIMNFFAEQGI